MAKRILFTFFCSANLLLNAQNLVLNPSFEQTTATACGGLFGMEDLSQVVNWNQAITPGSNSDSCSTADFFSACNPSIALSVPANPIGNQYAHSGTRYVGIITQELGSNWREYVQGQLSSPLVAGQSYCVSIYVSLGDNSSIGTNNIGIYFSDTMYHRNPCTVPSGSLIPFTPQVNHNCSNILDKTNWVRLQWNYTAAGGERHLVIGNFFNNANTTNTNAGGGGSLPMPMGYYYLDDVSVTPGTCCYADVADYTDTVCVTDPAFNLSAIAPTTCPATTLNGTWSGPGITNATLGTFNPATAGAGTHTVIYTLPCGAAATIPITVNPCTMLNVCRETNGNLTVSGGTAPYTWSQWSAGGSTPITTQAQCTACNAGNTWFFGTCLSGSMPVTSCSTPAGYVQYATGATVAAPTTFPAQVTDNAGGSQTFNSAADITALPSCSNCPAINLRPSVQQITCFGLSNGSVTLSPTGGTAPYTYVWSPNVSSGAAASNLAAGTYNVTATDANGCTATGSFVINQPTALNATVSQTSPAACGQNTGKIKLSVTGGTPGYTYVWSPNVSTVDSAVNLAGGTYRATVTDSQGCTDTIIAAITSSAGITLSIASQTHTTCGANNGRAKWTVSGGTAPYVYTWSPNVSTVDSATNLAAGTYNVTVRDANNCTTTSSVTINPSSAITVTLQNKRDVNCNATDGFIKVASSGVAPITYVWSPNVGNTDSVFNLSAGIYNVTATDVNGCSASASISINQTNGVNLSIQSTTNATCGQNNGRIKLNATGANTPFTYSWTPNVSTSDSAVNLAGGTYNVTVTDANSCSVSASITLTSSSAVTITSANVHSTSCGQNNGAIKVFAAGGSGTYTYAWTPNVGSADSVSNLSAGGYAVTVSDASGCSATSNYVVNPSTAPTVSITGNTTVCAGATTGLVCQAPVGFTGTYSWNTTPVSTTASVSVPAGNYCVTITETSGCSASACATVTQLQSPTIAINTPANYCEGTNATLTATGSASYVWNTSDTTASITISASGSYSVTATNANGCSASSNTTVVAAAPLGSPNLPDTVSDCDGIFIALNATTTNATSYLWSSGEDTAIISVGTSNLYIVTVANACETKRDSTIAIFENCGCRFFLPSAFTPNGDGNNDTYSWAANCNNIESFVLRVYNRWGEKVFETTDPAIGWNGTFKGEAQPMEVYVAYVIVTYNTGTESKEVSKSGSVTLLR